MPKLRITGQQLHILEVFYQATKEELTGGIGWYGAMGVLACKRMRLANLTYNCRHKLTRSVCFGVVAALSPQKSWSLNLKFADQLIIHGNCGQYSKQVLKAKRILGGENPEIVLRGEKEKSFYRCFMHHRTTRAVTIDSHALNVWLGEYASTEKTKVTPRLYRLAREDYWAVADAVGLMPHQLQATVWLAWRRIHGSRGHVQDMNAGL